MGKGYVADYFFTLKNFCNRHFGSILSYFWRNLFLACQKGYKVAVTEIFECEKKFFDMSFTLNHVTVGITAYDPEYRGFETFL
jgi:hypothetical protein